MVKVYINERFCKGCKYCITLCPAKILTLSEKLGPKGYFYAKVKEADKCTACRLCEIICPDFAIAIDTDV